MNPHFDPSAGSIAQHDGAGPTAAEPHYQAHAIAETYGSAVLMACADKSYRAFDHLSFKQYRDNVLASCGQPTDALEILLVEQSLWAHFRLGQLHGQAVEAKSAETTAMYNSAVTRLMAECRKHALALREYRTPTSPKQVTVVKQQNVAAGDQQIALLDGSRSALPEPAEKMLDTELPSNGAIRHAPTHPGHVNSGSQPEASPSRSPEPLETGSFDGRRSRTAPPRGADSQTVAPLNGPPDRRW